MVELAIKKWGAPIYVRHEIVHNKFVVDKLRAGAVTLNSAGRNAVDDIDKVGGNFAEQSSQLATGADKAAQLLSLVTEVMARQADSLTMTTEQARVDLDTISDSFNERSNELEALNKRSSERLSEAGGGLQEMAGQLATVSEEAANRIERATNRLDVTREEVAGAAVAAEEHMTSVAGNLEENVVSATSASSRAASSLEGIAKSLKLHIGELEGSLDQARVRFDDVGDHRIALFVATFRAADAQVFDEVDPPGFDLGPVGKSHLKPRHPFRYSESGSQAE